MTTKRQGNDAGQTPVKFSRLSKRGVLLGLSGSQFHCRRLRRGRTGVLALPRWRNHPRLHRTHLDPVRCVGLGRRRWTQARGVDTHPAPVGLARQRRTTRLPPPRAQAPPRRGARPARRRGQPAAMGRRRDRRRHGPRPTRHDPDRPRVGHPSGLRPARPDRAGTAGHQLVPSAGHRLPLGPDRVHADDGTRPARLRQGAGRVVAPPRSTGRLAGCDHLRRADRPRRPRW